MRPHYGPILSSSSLPIQYLLYHNLFLALFLPLKPEFSCSLSPIQLHTDLTPLALGCPLVLDIFTYLLFIVQYTVLLSSQETYNLQKREKKRKKKKKRKKSDGKRPFFLLPCETPPKPGSPV